MTDRPPACLFVPMGDEQTMNPASAAYQPTKHGLGINYDAVMSGRKAAEIADAAASGFTDKIILHNPGGFDFYGRGMRIDQVLTKPEPYQRALRSFVDEVRDSFAETIIYLGKPFASDERLTLSRIMECIEPWAEMGCAIGLDATGGWGDNAWTKHPETKALFDLLRARGITVYPETNDRTGPSVIDSNFANGEDGRGGFIAEGSIIIPYPPSAPALADWPAWWKQQADKGRVACIWLHEALRMEGTLDEVWATRTESPDLSPDTVPATPIDHIPDAGKKVRIYARLLQPSPWMTLQCDVITCANARTVSLIDGSGATVHSVPAGAVGNLPTNPVRLSARKPGAYWVKVEGNGESVQLPVDLGYEQDWTVIDRKGLPWTPDDNDALNTLKGLNRVILRSAMIGPGHNASSKVKPGRGTDAETRTLFLDRCSVFGDDKTLPRVDVAAAGEWGGGVWYYAVRTRGVNSLPADLRMIRGCVSEYIGSDAGQNCPLVYDYTVRNLRKPAGSKAHPDLLQGFFKTDPGAVFWCGVSNLLVDYGYAAMDGAPDEIFGQALFLRCPRVEAFIARDWRVNARPEWKSQIKGVTMDYLELRDISIVGQDFLITNDGQNGRDVVARHSLVENLSAKTVSVEPGSGVTL